ncbi:hypothetical protein AAFM79_12755 [Trichormus azollae HNT15244]
MVVQEVDNQEVDNNVDAYLNFGLDDIFTCSWRVRLYWLSYDQSKFLGANVNKLVI